MHLQETRWIGDKAKLLSKPRYKLWKSGKDWAKNGVGIIMDKTLKDVIVDVKRIGDKIIAVKVVLGEVTTNIVIIYASWVRRGDEGKILGWFRPVDTRDT